jgi:hypothetical protein
MLKAVETLHSDKEEAGTTARTKSKCMSGVRQHHNRRESEPLREAHSMNKNHM